MSLYEVRCVKKTPPGDKHDHIVEIGDRQSNPAWKFTVKEVIQMIAAGHKFVIKDQLDPRIEAIIRPFPDRVNGQFILSTPDGVLTDNILGLPECR
jgi:hypothetical protein